MTKPERGKILIVDDEEHLLLIYKKLLSSAGYDVITAANGAEAVEMAKKHQPQLVLLDIVLPDISGIEVLKILKKQPETKGCFVVLITSKLVSPEEQSEGLETGADGYLPKPLHNRELVARVNSFMRHKTAIDNLTYSEERFRKIVQKNADGIIIIDADGIIRFANPEAEKMFGKTKGELAGNNFGHPVIWDESTEVNITRKNSGAGTSEMRAVEIFWEGESMTLVSLRDISERKIALERLHQIEWMLDTKNVSEKDDYLPEYGDLSELNQNGLILNTVGREQLRNIASEYMDLLETSAAVYERNGDYALGLFSSGWCQMMDKASRRLCDTTSNQKALNSGKWLCHESCWQDASLKAIKEGKPADIECHGGINIYAAPVKSGGKTVGAINFGYGDPPKDEEKLRELSEKYKLPVDELRKKANAYPTRPDFIVELAKKRLRKSADYLEFIIERRLADKALRRSEENLRVTLDSIGDAVIATDTNGRITRMNPVAESLTGWHLSDIEGKPLKEAFRIVNAFSGEEVENPVNKVLKTGAIVGLANHTKLISKNEKEFQIADSAAPIKNDDGKVIGVVLVFRDVTEEYRMQEKLKASEEHYRTVFENTGTATTILEKNGTILLANKQFARLSDFSVKEIENKKVWMEFVVPEDLARMKEQHELRRKNSNSALREYEFRFIDRNKNLKHIHLYIDMIPGTDKSVASLLDVTDRKIAEDDLAHSEKLMRYVIENTKSGVAVHDKDLKYIYVSQQYLKQYKVNEKNVIGRCHYDVFPDLPQKWRDVHQRVLKGEVLGADRDPYHRDDGTVEWTRWQCRPWYEANGAIGGIIVYTEVITDRVEAELELKETVKELQKARKASLNLIEDLTEEIEKRKQYEKELKESESRFSIAFKASPAPLVISEIETGQFIDVNNRWVDMLGFSRDEQIGRTSKEVGIWRNPSERDRVIKYILKNGFFKDEYIEFNTKSGDTILALWSAEIIALGGKKLMLSMIHDITKRVKAENELRNLKNNLEIEVQQKTQELRERVAELERFQNATIEREFRIKELRDEIEILKSTKS
jgi:PAS domain S-box-containing protein